jgi:toxin ParE1/3/4
VKAYRVQLTDRAIDDLVEIEAFIAQDSTRRAQAMLAKLKARIASLQLNAEGFARAPEDEFVPYTLRQVIERPYRVLYRVEGADVVVLHVRHGARRHARVVDLD